MEYEGVGRLTFIVSTLRADGILGKMLLNPMFVMLMSTE